MDTLVDGPRADAVVMVTPCGSCLLQVPGRGLPGGLRRGDPPGDAGGADARRVPRGPGLR